MDIISIKNNGTWEALPTPSIDGYKCVPNDLVRASRNARGNIPDVTLIATKRNIEITWNALTHAEFVRVCRLTGQSVYATANKSTFTVRYWDLHDQSYKEGKFYRGSDLTIMGKAPKKEINGVIQFSRYEVKLSLVEC